MDEKPLNPFPIYGYFGAEFFCDRDKEKDTIVDSLRHGRNITLFAPRRIGKTALIHHAITYLPKWQCVYIDLQRAADFKDFTNLFLSALMNAVKKNKGILKKTQEWLMGFRPVLSSDPYTGKFEVEVDFKSSSAERTTISEALKLLDQNTSSVIALDEFQHIHSWGDSHIEGWFRAEVQKLKNTRFIFAGSQFHLISEMFNSSKRPFYASTQSLNIDKIDPSIYSDFIVQKFHDYKIKIDRDDVTAILSWADGNTYNVQLLCNRVFSKSAKQVKRETIHEAITEIYSENNLSYFALRNSLQKLQWKVLEAIAKEGMVFSPTSSEFLRKHGLSSGPAVLRVLKYLTEKELVYQYLTKEGEKYYCIYDVVLMRWIQKKYF